MGDAMRQMADVKYSLDDNIKQNFLEPLHHLQTKDLKEVMVRLLEKSHARAIRLGCSPEGLSRVPSPFFTWKSMRSRSISSVFVVTAPPEEAARPQTGLWLQAKTSGERYVKVPCMHSLLVLSRSRSFIDLFKRADVGVGVGRTCPCTNTSSSARSWKSWNKNCSLSRDDRKSYGGRGP